MRDYLIKGLELLGATTAGFVVGIILAIAYATLTFSKEWKGGDRP
jgi:hypothetical protein